MSFNLFKPLFFQHTIPENLNVFTGVYDLTSHWPLITNPVVIWKENGVLFIKIKWLTVGLTQVKPLVLKMAHFDSLPYCEEHLASWGLANTKLTFAPPETASGKSPQFNVSGISLYGHASFKRNPTIGINDKSW